MNPFSLFVPVPAASVGLLRRELLDDDAAKKTSARLLWVRGSLLQEAVPGKWAAFREEAAGRGKRSTADRRERGRKKELEKASRNTKSLLEFYSRSTEERSPERGGERGAGGGSRRKEVEIKEERLDVGFGRTDEAERASGEDGIREGRESREENEEGSFSSPEGVRRGSGSGRRGSGDRDRGMGPLGAMFAAWLQEREEKREERGRGDVGERRRATGRGKAEGDREGRGEREREEGDREGHGEREERREKVRGGEEGKSHRGETSGNGIWCGQVPVDAGENGSEEDPPPLSVRLARRARGR